MTRNDAFAFAARLFNPNARPVRIDELTPGVQRIINRASKPRKVTVLTKPKAGRELTRIITVKR